MSHVLRLILARHGQSEANAGATAPDPESSPLTALGERQAAAIADGLEAPPELIVVSRFRRARETAEIVSRRFAGGRVEEWPVHEFQYLGATAYRGTTYRERRPAVDTYWEACDPERVCEAGAESFAAFLARVHAVRERLERSPERSILVIGHKKFLHALVWSWASGPRAADAAAMRDFRAFDRGRKFPNGAWIEVELSKGRARIGETRTAPAPPRTAA